MTDCVTTWHRGLACDHIYGNCPGLRRGEPELRRAGWWDEEPRPRTLDPHGTDVCGLCLHRHNRAEHRAGVAA